MKNRILTWAFFVMFAGMARAQGDTLLMKIGGRPVFCDEYLYAYRKQAGTLTPADFLSRFIRLKWEVCCAQANGLDTTSGFRQQYESCKRRLQAEASRRPVSRRDGKAERGEWVGHICVRVPQHVPHAGVNRLRAALDSLSLQVRQSDGMEQWIREHRDSLPRGWQAEVVRVLPCQLPNDLLDHYRQLKPGEVSKPFLSAAGLHLLGRLVVDEPACELSATPAEDGKARQFMLREYHDGLLAGLLEDSLFRVDEHRLSKYYKKHKKRYRWELPHFKGIVLQANDAEKLERLLKYLKGFPQDKWLEAIDEFDRIGGSRWLKVEYGLFQIGKNACIDKLYFGQGSFTPSADYPYVRVLGKKLKRRPESYKDVYEQVKQDYRASVLQKEEAKWKKIFKVEINEEVLKTVNNHDAI